jgi:hypothetical protein
MISFSDNVCFVRSCYVVFNSHMFNSRTSIQHIQPLFLTLYCCGVTMIVNAKHNWSNLK